MKALFYQVVRGSDTYFETEDRDQAITLFDDLLMGGFRDRDVPETAQQRRESYIGPPIGVREIRSKMVVRACGGAMRVSPPPPKAREIADDLKVLLRQINE